MAVITTTQSYWSEKEYFNSKEIASIMTRSRFESISSALHFSSTSTSKDKFFKIRSFLELINEDFQENSRIFQLMNVWNLLLEESLLNSICP